MASTTTSGWAVRRYASTASIEASLPLLPEPIRPNRPTRGLTADRRRDTGIIACNQDPHRFPSGLLRPWGLADQYRSHLDQGIPKREPLIHPLLTIGETLDVLFGGIKAAPRLLS